MKNKIFKRNDSPIAKKGQNRAYVCRRECVRHLCLEHSSSAQRSEESAPFQWGYHYVILCYMIKDFNNTGQILLEYQKKVYGYKNIDRLCQVLELPRDIFLSYCIGTEPKRIWLIAQVNKFIRLGKPMPILVWADDTFELVLGEIQNGQFETIQRRVVGKGSLRK
jgi:hypothetical protein